LSIPHQSLPASGVVCILEPVRGLSRTKLCILEPVRGQNFFLFSRRRYGNVIFALRPLAQPAKFKTKTRLKLASERVLFEFL
jgi:hypothetical protein